MILNDRPMNAETPAHLLDDAITPISRHFIRNNGIPPQDMAADGWEMRVDGFVDRPLTLSINDLRRDFEVVSRQLVIECGGNGRAFFDPGASGNQWTVGAVACAEWTGVRLADVLKTAGVQREAIYTAHEGADTHLSGDPAKRPLSRGVPIEKAMDPNNLIAFGMNGGDIHPMNGAPLRLVVPGWPGSCSQKWLTRITLRDQVHDGAKMTGTSYRIPRYPVAPGTDVPVEDFEIIEAMPVKSLITHPVDGIKLSRSSLEVRGHAWAGNGKVAKMHVSHDFGATWQRADLDEPANPFAWQHWRARLTFPKPGYYEIWAKATDDHGVSQPFTIGWNPKGYLNNFYHRIAVTVTE
ncbi:molybdopterin containing oxidoreductase [Iodidimonas gelatinilytica]|uniref:Molybdopterin containing oxidoreductase n=2 Tax=Iodidimonas gelatinilytica TaxID=1236966 RepID=A0A5A7MNB8_9PROT|nr:sulfite oxidase [Iodidimonas gelatinilytica]GEQ96389.1 molybdopterin containing oxidoreductase [Iodidimonas gelatinilytica]